MSRERIQEYTDWIVKNFQPRFPNLGEWYKIGDKTNTIYYTRELYDIYLIKK